MVNSDGQLYTIEGFAAALIMLITAYLVVNATSVYTAGDTHINDMQLEGLGTDALKMMDTPINWKVKSPLQEIIRIDDGATFNTMFLNYMNIAGSGPRHDIQFIASYTCRDSNNITHSIPINNSRKMTGGEHAVRATRWVIVNKDITVCDVGTIDRAVLVEVLLWRD